MGPGTRVFVDVFSTRLFSVFWLLLVLKYAFFYVYLLYSKLSVDENLIEKQVTCFKCFSRTNRFTIIHLESTFPVTIAFDLLECMTLFLGPIVEFHCDCHSVPSCRLGSKSDDMTCAVK